MPSRFIPSEVLSRISRNHVLVCLPRLHALLGILCAVYGRLYLERSSTAAGYAWSADASPPAVCCAQSAVSSVLATRQPRRVLCVLRDNMCAQLVQASAFI